MTPELDIPKLRADLKAAAPGPWATIPPGGPQGDFFGIFNSEKGWIVADRIFGNRPKGEDAAHIVSAHNSFEALLDRAELADRYEAVIERVRGVHEVQGRKGNWDYDSYMVGMFNGLELALCTLEGREPAFRTLRTEVRAALAHAGEEQP